MKKIALIIFSFVLLASGLAVLSACSVKLSNFRQTPGAVNKVNSGNSAINTAENNLAVDQNIASSSNGSFLPLSDVVKEEKDRIKSNDKNAGTSIDYETFKKGFERSPEKIDITFPPQNYIVPKGQKNLNIVGKGYTGENTPGIVGYRGQNPETLKPTLYLFSKNKEETGRDQEACAKSECLMNTFISIIIPNTIISGTTTILKLDKKVGEKYLIFVARDLNGKWLATKVIRIYTQENLDLGEYKTITLPEVRLVYDVPTYVSDKKFAKENLYTGIFDYFELDDNSLRVNVNQNIFTDAAAKKREAFDNEIFKGMLDAAGLAELKKVEDENAKKLEQEKIEYAVFQNDLEMKIVVYPATLDLSDWVISFPKDNFLKDVSVGIRVKDNSERTWKILEKFISSIKKCDSEACVKTVDETLKRINEVSGVKAEDIVTAQDYISNMTDRQDNSSSELIK
jgi:hypothetical protein